MLREVVRRNRVRDGIVYLQVTRGVARRDHAFPPRRHARRHRRHRAQRSISPTTESDRRRRHRGHHRAGQPLGRGSTSSRWRCCRTCSPSRRRASRAPTRPGSSTRDGRVTEGSSTNAWIVTRDGTLVTRPADHGILRGITRTVLLDVLAAQELTLEERPFTVEEAQAAREAFITSASQIVMPVVRDRRPAGRQRRARA